MAKKMANCIEKIGQVVSTGYQKMEDGVVGGYRKMESSIVHGFEKISNKCIDVLLAREGETTEQARQRLIGNRE